MRTGVKWVGRLSRLDVDVMQSTAGHHPGRGICAVKHVSE